MRAFELPAGGPRARGRAHGEAFREEIHSLARLRTELAVAQGRFRDEVDVRRVAALHLPVLEAFDRALAEELNGIAEGADLDPASVVVLNHYTDLKHLDPDAPMGSEEEDCSAVVAATPAGPILGQTWDMHGSAAPFVVMLRVPDDGPRPAAWMLSITGCLGMAGLNAAGLGVTINNLKSLDGRVGVVWPALVRRLLAERAVPAARHVLMTAPLSSGHCYSMADATETSVVETSGRRKNEVFAARFAEAPEAAFVHTNHCVGDEIGAVSKIGETSTTLARHAWLEASLAERRLEGPLDLWARLGTHENYPGSVCTHLATEEAPHAMLTCAGLVMDLEARVALAAPGCIHGVEPERFAFG